MSRTRHRPRLRTRAALLLAAVGVVLGTCLLTAGPAQAAPDPCGALSGAIKQACSGAVTATGTGPLLGAVDGVSHAISCATDPVGCVAKSTASAADWFLGRLADGLRATTSIDPSDPAVLKIYSLMFGLSVFLTLIVAILSVARSAGTGRAGDAIKTATAYLVLSVAASAFFPLAVFLGNELTDAAATAFSTVGASDLSKFMHSTGGTLVALNTVGMGGPFTQLLFALVTVICALILWIELVLRKAAFYAVLVFAPAVFTGLTSQRMWDHVKRYVYFLLAILAAKPVVVIILSLAASLTANSNDGSSILATCALLLVAIFSVGLLFKLIPHVGEQLGAAVNARRELSGAGPVGAVPGPATIARRSIQTHAVSRTTGGARRAGGAAAAAGPATAAGVAGATIAAQRVGSAVGSAAGTVQRTGNGRSTPPPEPAKPPTTTKAEQ